MPRAKKSQAPPPPPEDQLKTQVHAQLDGHPLDAAYAFQKALNLVCGKGNWSTVSYRAMRWPGDDELGWRHPTELRIPTGVNKNENISWGRIVAPEYYKGWLTQAVEHKRQRPILTITGQVARESMPAVEALVSRAESLLQSGSLFRGKAVQLLRQESVFRPGSGLEMDLFGTLPRFLDLSNIEESELIYPAHVMRQVRNTLFTPIERSFLCRKAGVPLKRGILLDGTYGVGKTLCAFITAKKAERNGWTFVYVDDVDNLEIGIQFALHYQPAVVYSEDIDQAEGIQDRDSRANHLLNALDSIESKNAELMIVLTTNHLKGLMPALLRPGRIDALLHIPPPDEATAECLLRQYARGLISEDESLIAVRQKLAGQIPAVIREVVERAKLASIADTRDEYDTWRLTAADLLREAATLVDHIEHIKHLKEPVRLSEREKAATILANAVSHREPPSREQPGVFLRNRGALTVVGAMEEQ